jgi:hypothetical protein
MTTHRRYCFSHPGEWSRPGSHAKILEILQGACEHRWWYRDPSVDGEAFNRLSMCFTVSARDQWWCHRRAMKLAVDAYYAVGLAEPDLPTPEWEPLAPHANRGRYRVSQ